MIRTINNQKNLDRTLTWLDPAGGAGDLILLGSAMYAAHRKDGKTFGINRKSYTVEVLLSHPAVKQIAQLPEGFPRVEIPAPAQDNVRSFEAIATAIGLPPGTPEEIEIAMQPGVSEGLGYFSVEPGAVFLCTGRDYQGAGWTPAKWEALAAMIAAKTGKPAVQVGATNDMAIRGAMDLRGRARLMQAIALVKEYASAVVCVDSYMVQAAKWAKKPAVVLWGSPFMRSRSYPEQANIAAKPAPDNSIDVSPEEVMDKLSAVSGPK